MLEKIVVKSDGGCRNNPGAGSFGYVIDFVGLGRKITGGGFLVQTTNNLAEYAAIAEAARFLLRVDELGPEIQFLSDSKLCVEQLNGNWQLKEPSLRDIYNRALGHIAKLMLRVPKVTLSHIPRALNEEADQICNDIMDEHGVVGVAKPRRAAFLR